MIMSVLDFFEIRLPEHVCDSINKLNEIFSHDGYAELDYENDVDLYFDGK
jgi:hypothetical protein